MKTMFMDARGLMCPLPVLKARKKLLQTDGPVQLSVQVDDAATEKDFRLFCDEAGYHFRGAQAGDACVTFVIEKA